MNKDTGQLCPTCQTGQDTYLLDILGYSNVNTIRTYEK